MKKLLIITNRPSDLSETFASCASAELVTVLQAFDTNLDVYDAIALLGGTEENAVILPAGLRIKLESFADSKKPMFLEYINSFRCVYSAPKKQISHHRLISLTDSITGIEKGGLLDSHYCSYARPYYSMPNAVSLLEYRDYIPSHDTADTEGAGDTAFWQDGNLLSCAFRMCNYAKARFAPRQRWESLVKYICSFLGVTEFTLPEYPLRMPVGAEAEPDKCIDRALGWLEQFLVGDGSEGIREGLSHNILPDGTQLHATNIRTDCSGEAAGAFIFSGNEKYIGYAERLFDFCFDKMMIKGGDFDGMLRWTEEAWEVCYQDDVARTVIPALLASRYGITKKYLPDVFRALRFLVRSTCKDGLRPARTDNLEFIRESKSIETLKDAESGYPSAHYNAWYSAALLLAYMEGGDGEFLETGVRGLESLMKLYPDTTREHSETSEMCRLIFPLAVLYAATGKREHKDMLMRVTDDLQRVKHPSGGYAEWDTGYKAACSKAVGGECSLLGDNGDPVCDLLYSVNWLPLGFAFSYDVTGEERFLELYGEIERFICSCQSISENPLHSGCWGRGFDMDRYENYGIPHDVGWGPCAAESGWTVSELAMGLEIGRLIKTAE